MGTVKIIQIAVSPLSEFGAEVLYGLDNEFTVYYFNTATQTWVPLPMTKGVRP